MTAGLEYNSLWLAADLRQFLSERPQLELKVHSVFETSANLLADDELITLATCCRELMPMGCIADLAGIEQWKLKAGDIVVHEQGKLRLPQGDSINLREAEVKTVTLAETSESSTHIDIASLSVIRNILLENDGGGISDLAALLPETDQVDQPLNVYSSYIKEDLFSFLDSLGMKDYETAVGLAGSLLGFGPGLTPSCDDFLTGIILLLYYKDVDNCKDANCDFFQKIVTMAQKNTTVVSYHMIKNAAAGKAYESYLAVVNALSVRNPDHLTALLDRVLRYGASSGSDFLFGVYCAGLLLYERENMIVVDSQDKKAKISEIR